MEDKQLINEKRCSKCRLIKPIYAFGKKNYNKDGLNHYCLNCERERGKLKYAKPEIKEQKKYYQIKRLYGLTKEDYLNKLDAQNNQCVICNTILLNDKNTHIDHNHTTGKIRDILCSNCNHILGIIENNSHYIQNLLRYIDKHKL